MRLTSAAPMRLAGGPFDPPPPRRHPPPRAGGRPPRSGASAMIGSARTHDLPPRRPTARASPALRSAVERRRLKAHVMRRFWDGAARVFVAIA
jgi:hypothetical protein